MEDKLKHIGIAIVFLFGAFGGGSLLNDILKHFSCPDILSNVAGLIYWCAYCMLFSKIELKSDAKNNYQLGYDEGYNTGHEEVFLSAAPAYRKAVDEKYDAGYEAGRADGWDIGYSAAQRDMKQ